MTITTKFKPGDSVYFMHENAVNYAKVNRIEITVYDSGPHTRYKLSDPKSNYPHTVNEEDCFATKQDLLNSL